MKVNKAVIVAAGWGTRFLPVTKSQPKEMLPLIDKPLIQYAVEEAVSSGMKQVVVITAPGKQVISDYFAPAPELESFLEQRGKTKLLGEVRSSLPNWLKLATLRKRSGWGWAMPS